MKELLVRVIVAAIAIPALVLLVLNGGILLVGFVSVLTALGFLEYLGLAKVPPRIFPELTVLCVLVAGNWAVFYAGMQALMLVIILCFGIISLSEVFARNVAVAGSRIVTVFFGAFYMSLFNAFVLIRHQSPEPLDGSGEGAYWILFAFAVIWICDTAAYFVGSAIGRHKMSPVVSPKKSWEGFAGGMVFGTATAIAFSLFALRDKPLWQLLLAALIISLVGQFGDLVESIFKRIHGIKDSSHIIPGHGGVLDRFDSLLFALPTLFILLRGLRLWP